MNAFDPLGLDELRRRVLLRQQRDGQLLEHTRLAARRWPVPLTLLLPTFLKIGRHGNHVHVALPRHQPELVHRVVHRALRRNQMHRITRVGHLCGNVSVGRVVQATNEVGVDVCRGCICRVAQHDAGWFQT